ncbi:LAQU0S03e02828g1_1 [Lachancea quebecensis]|uniref:LAQU0S03e02828g1_1 n=1 Tax=Lachancea quebecensis TaxID=1654605 RepID=A0A0P1KNS8_9SACH|nr:LAQU0S03e02828g1_1 [Lachancea quebecensis]
MVELVSKTLSSNRLLLTQFANELSSSFAKPTLEFVDILIEALMYPRGSGNSLMDWTLDSEKYPMLAEKHKYVHEDLGYGCLLEMVHARQLLVKLNTKAPASSPDFTNSILALLEEIHEVLAHLLEHLKSQARRPMGLDLYKSIVQGNLPHFNHAFCNFNILVCILHQLQEFPENTSTGNGDIFQIAPKTMESIKTFSADNLLWFEGLMLGSRALREYLLLQDYHTDYLDSINTVSIPRGISSEIHSSDFGIFVQVRKSKLKISHRRVF